MLILSLIESRMAQGTPEQPCCLNIALMEEKTVNANPVGGQKKQKKTDNSASCCVLYRRDLNGFVNMLVLAETQQLGLYSSEKINFKMDLLVKEETFASERGGKQTSC